MTASSGNLLLIAARRPVAGETKTRLGAAIGMERAAQLYRAFLIDLANRFGIPRDGFDLGWAHTPESAPFADVLASLCPGIETGSMRFVSQVGGDWAVRQANLLRWGAEQGYARTVLTASDSPQMTVRVVEEAFAALETADVVIGRVHDGGYFLIGVRGFHDVVTGVPMSTASAAEALEARAEELGLSVATVEPMFDVDVVEDLALLVEFVERDPEAAPATRQALLELGIFGSATR